MTVLASYDDNEVTVRLLKMAPILLDASGKAYR